MKLRESARKRIKMADAQNSDVFHFKAGGCPGGMGGVSFGGFGLGTELMVR